MNIIPNRAQSILALICIAAIISFGSLYFDLLKRAPPTEVVSTNLQRVKSRCDVTKVIKYENYPVCSNLHSLQQSMLAEESVRSEAEAIYKDMLLEGKLNCGIVRVGSGIFEKRYRHPFRSNWHVYFSIVLFSYSSCLSL